MRHLSGLIGSFCVVLVMLTVPAPVHAQNYEVVPKRTWGANKKETVEKRKIYRPYNLNSILKGKPQERPHEPDLPVSRNPLEAARLGKLPYSKVLSYTADANSLRMSLQLYDPYTKMSSKKLEKTREKLKAQERQAAAAMLKRRNDYYRKKGLSDEYTEYSDQQAARAQARNNKFLTRGNSTSARAASGAPPKIPSEVRLFMEETKRLAGLKLKPGTTFTDEGLQNAIAKPLTRERDKSRNIQNAGTSSNVVVNRGTSSSHIIVPKKEQNAPLLKRVFPFFY